MRSLIAPVLLLSALVTLGACGDASTSEDDGVVGDFLTSPGDETLDPADPSTNPDPQLDDPVSLLSADGKPTGAQCTKHDDLLSPSGLTFVIHFSKHADEAQRAFDHLHAVRRYLRGRDMFMVEHGSPLLPKLKKEFPCARFHYIAYPSEMKAALASGNLIDGVSVDWEGSAVDAHSAGYSADALRAYAHDIRQAGKVPGFVPAWPRGFDDAAIAKTSHMSYELAQIQGGCVNGASNFAHAAHGLLADFHAHGLGVRRVGFEISMDSVASADNHVDAARAADCTRAAYGHGARAIYIYGNGHDHLVDYFHALGKMGVRTPR